MKFTKQTKQVVILYASTLSGVLLGVVASIINTRFLSPADYVEYDNFKRLIKEWLDNHPDEYADFVEEMNDKKFKGFFKVFKIAPKLAPKYKEAARRCV